MATFFTLNLLTWCVTRCCIGITVPMMRLCAPCAFVSVAFFVCLAIGCNVINAWPTALIYTYTGNALKGTYGASLHSAKKEKVHVKSSNFGQINAHV